MKSEEQERDEGKLIGQDAAQFMFGLVRESERAAVVLGVSRLDVALESLLKKLLRSPSSKQDELFDTDRHLGTLSGKIILAHRLGVIDNNFRRAMEILKKIRNEFAHSVEPVSLTTGRHRQRLDVIVPEVRRHPKWAETEDAIRKLGASDTLVDFATAVTLMIIELESVACDSEQLAVARTTGLQGPWTGQL